MAATLAQIAALKAEIYQAIDKYTTSASKPPYSFDELAIMGAVCRMDLAQRVTHDKILEWILHTFRWYNNQAIDHYVRSEQGLQQANHRELTVKGLREALVRYDVPLRSVYESWDRYDFRVNTFVVNMTEASTYLRERLQRYHLPEQEESQQPEVQQESRFMTLPAELRLIIYDKLLTFDQRGLTPHYYRCNSLSCDGPYVHLHLPPRETDTFIGNEHEAFAMRPGPDAPRLDGLLAIARICKTIYNEVLPVFYGQNRFNFPAHGRLDTKFGLLSFVKVMRRLAPSRIRHLGDLSIDFDLCELDFWANPLLNAGWHAPIRPTIRLGDVLRTVQRIATLVQKLQRLEPHFTNDAQWFKMSDSARRDLGVKRDRRFSKAKQIPIKVALAEMASHAHELVITGSGPLIEVYIRTKAAKIKAAREAEQKQKEAGKRKAEEERMARGERTTEERLTEAEVLAKLDANLEGAAQMFQQAEQLNDYEGRVLYYQKAVWRV